MPYPKPSRSQRWLAALAVLIGGLLILGVVALVAYALSAWLAGLGTPG